MLAQKEQKHNRGRDCRPRISYDAVMVLLCSASIVCVCQGGRRSGGGAGASVELRHALGALCALFSRAAKSEKTASVASLVRGRLPFSSHLPACTPPTRHRGLYP